MSRATNRRIYDYLGVPAERWELRRMGAASTRVDVTTWLGDAKGQPVEHPKGTTVLRLMKGDWYKGTGVNLAEPVILEPGTGYTAILAAAEELLGRAA